MQAAFRIDSGPGLESACASPRDHCRRRVRRSVCGAGRSAGLRCASPCSTAGITTCSSRCSTRSRPQRSRQVTSPHRSGGFSGGRPTSKSCWRNSKASTSPGAGVILTDGELGYDYLILATGATHAYFGHDEWRSLAPGLKTLEDALEIRRRVLLAFEHAEREADLARRNALLTFVVVGGGPTGVELAGALAEISRQSLARNFRHFDPGSARVLLMEGGPAVLTTFPEPLRQAAQKHLEQLGVEVRTNSIVTRVVDGGVETTDEFISAATVLWAAGVAASPLGRTLGVPIDRAGRVAVQHGPHDCRTPGSIRRGRSRVAGRREWQAAARSGTGCHTDGEARCPQYPTRHLGPALRRVQVQRSREHGNHRPGIRGCRLWLAPACAAGSGGWRGYSSISSTSSDFGIGSSSSSSGHGPTSAISVLFASSPGMNPNLAPRRDVAHSPGARGRGGCAPSCRSCPRRAVVFDRSLSARAGARHSAHEPHPRRAARSRCGHVHPGWRGAVRAKYRDGRVAPCRWRVARCPWWLPLRRSICCS